MILKYFLAFLFLSPLAAAEPRKTDCTAQDKTVIESPKFAQELYPEAQKLLRYDCVNLNFSGHPESFVFVGVFVMSNGPEVQLAWFDRKSFKSAASNLAKTSDPLGLNAFPVSIAGVSRLGFAHPKIDQNGLGFYVNVQTAPAVTRLIRFELDLKNKSFHESNNRVWLVEAGVLPKIYEDGGIWRALIVRRAVEL